MPVCIVIATTTHLQFIVTNHEEKMVDTEHAS